jgi:thiamine pyrophosphate-dependent acetolactate synthase large subunit-like protein
MSETIGAALAGALREHGVQVVFGIPGTHNLGLYAHLPTAGIRHVTPRHEQGGGYAADGYARVSGKPGVLITTTGPGILNALTSLTQAWSDSSAVLAITPSLPDARPSRSTGFLHETRDQNGALTAMLGNVREVKSPAAARQAVREAFTDFASRRPRPWVIEVPLDRFDHSDDIPFVASGPDPIIPSPADADVDAAADLLAAARNAAVIVGGGSRSAATEVRRLVAALGVPVVSTANGRGVVDERGPLHLATSLHLASVQTWLRGCDVVLVLGSELGQSDTWTTDPVLAGSVIRVDLDAAQADMNSPAPSVFLHGRVSEVAARLTEALAGRRPFGSGASADSEGARDPEPPIMIACATEAAGMVAPWRPLLQGLRAALPPDAILATDNAMCVYYGAHVGFPVYQPGGYLYPTGLGTLGFALPAAIGALVAGDLSAAAVPRPVAVLSGDGGFQFTLQELATARSLGRALPIVVVENRGYGEIRDEMRERGDAPTGADAAGPDLVELARAYDCAGIRLPAASNDPAVARLMHNAVDVALTLDRPMIIVVHEGGK